MEHGRQKHVDDVQTLIDRMNFLHAVSQKISEMKSLPDLLNDILESSKLVVNAEASSLLLYDPGDGALHFQVATGDKGTLVKEFSVEMGAGIAGWVAQHRQSLLIQDCYRDPRFNPDYDKRSHFKTRSMICVPLIRKEALLGVIEVINKKGGGIFDEWDLSIFETLAAQCAIAIENARLIEIQIETKALERELETARSIQQKLLPAQLPKYQDVEVAAKLIPAKQVGGDYYTILKINDDETLLLIADVAGKGIPAALIVSTVDSCLHTFLKLNHQSFELLPFMDGLNRVLIDSVTSDKFVTCWCGLYNHTSRTLMSVNAGHNPPYLLQKGATAPIELNAGGLFLGIFSQSFEGQSLAMNSGDVLVFYTDGVTEALNEQGQEYEEARLIRLLGTCGANSAGEILAAIEQDVRMHVGDAQQSDDFTCAVLRVK
ncbi:MAG: SpoIIE family protein phosphatase [Candidatus Zhuqueibacterota bacterium]